MSPVLTGCLGGLAAALNSSPVETGCLQTIFSGSVRLLHKSSHSSGSSFSSSVAVTMIFSVGHSRTILRAMNQSWAGVI